MSISPLIIGSALATAMSVGALVFNFAPPPRRLRSRVRPYVVPQAGTGRSIGGGVLRSIVMPMVTDLADLLSRLIDRTSRDVTVLRLRQAGWHSGLDENEMIGRYRIAQLKATVLAVGIAVLSGIVLQVRPTVMASLCVLSAVVGVTRTRGLLDRAIEERRDLMRVEIYTVNQLLAMRVRAGGGVIQAVKLVTQRGTGEVVSELAEALRLHRAGWPGPEAFRRIAELSPEPFCTRTYRLLASAEERGADLAGALLALSEDVRETRREAMRRTATRRRAAMLIPTIAILAPVLILFVAAPLPYLITSWR